MAAASRPKIIAVFSVLTMILVLLSFPMLLMPTIRKLGDFVPMLLGILITLHFVAAIGIWHMKRWGVHLLIIMCFARVLAYLSLGIGGFRFGFFILYSFGFLVVFLAHYRKMDSNL